MNSWTVRTLTQLSLQSKQLALQTQSTNEGLKLYAATSTECAERDAALIDVLDRLCNKWAELNSAIEALATGQLSAELEELTKELMAERALQRAKDSGAVKPHPFQVIKGDKDEPTKH